MHHLSLSITCIYDKTWLLIRLTIWKNELLKDVVHTQMSSFSDNLVGRYHQIAIVLLVKDADMLSVHEWKMGFISLVLLSVFIAIKLVLIAI